MTVTWQPWLLDTGTAFLEVQVARPVPANRVQVVWHPRGWQVALVSSNSADVLPTVYAAEWDAEERAAALAVKLDLALWLDDDPDGVIAAGLVMGVEWRDEIRDAETRWMR